MPSELSIFVASRPQVEASRLRSFIEWGRGMSLEVFTERDNMVDRSAVAAENRFTTWVLAPRDNPETLDFMCACETYQREVFVSDTKCTTSNAAVGYGIASVFTPPDKRGKGYAKHMLRLLHWVLSKPDARPAHFPTAEWGAPPQEVEGFANASVSVLYSDVGHAFYLACGLLPGTMDGWRPAPRAATIWKRVGDVPKGEQTREWKWLKNEDVVAFWEKDSELIGQEMKGRGGEAFSFTPRRGVAAFHPLRIELFLKAQRKQFDCYGIASGSNETLAYASWTYVFPAWKRLLITRLRVTPDLFSELISAIIGFCKDQGMEEIEIWNLPEGLVQQAASLGGVTADMNDHLPMVKWYGSQPGDEVEWVNNEKFCWC